MSERKPTGKTYRLERLEDFFQVPAECLERCLRETMAGIIAGHAVASSILAVAAAQGVDASQLAFRWPIFEWTDDDELTISINVTTPEAAP